MGRARTTAADGAAAQVSDEQPGEVLAPVPGTANDFEPVAKQPDPFDGDDDKAEAALSKALRPSPAGLPPLPSTKEPPVDDLPDPPEGEPAPPHYGTPRAAKPDGVVPRVLNQLERAPAGLARYKIHCRNYQPQPVRYILAQPDQGGEVEARRCYLKSQGLDVHLKRLAQSGVDQIDPPQLVVTKLPD